MSGGVLFVLFGGGGVRVRVRVRAQRAFEYMIVSKIIILFTKII